MGVMGVMGPEGKGESLDNDVGVWECLGEVESARIHVG